MNILQVIEMCQKVNPNAKYIICMKMCHKVNPNIFEKFSSRSNIVVVGIGGPWFHQEPGAGTLPRLQRPGKSVSLAS